MDTERLLIAVGLAVTLLIGGVAIIMLDNADSLDSDGPSPMKWGTNPAACHVDPEVSSPFSTRRVSVQPSWARW